MEPDTSPTRQDELNIVDIAVQAGLPFAEPRPDIAGKAGPDMMRIVVEMICGPHHYGEVVMEVKGDAHQC